MKDDNKREIAEVAGVSIDTVQKVAREVYPEKFGQGKRVTYLKAEAISVMSLIRKRNFVELPKDAEVLPQTSEVITRSDLAAIWCVNRNRGYETVFTIASKPK